MPLLDHFEFTFACESPYGAKETLIHGTGGQILAELRRLLSDVRHLNSLSINHLLLDVGDASTLLDDVVVNNADTLRSVQLLNITRFVCLYSQGRLNYIGENDAFCIIGNAGGDKRCGFLYSAQCKWRSGENNRTLTLTLFLTLNLTLKLYFRHCAIYIAPNTGGSAPFRPIPFRPIPFRPILFRPIPSPNHNP